MEYCRSQDIQLQAWGPLAQGKFSGRDVSKEPEHIQEAATLCSAYGRWEGNDARSDRTRLVDASSSVIQPIIGTTNPARIQACQDAERQAEQMSRDEWYLLYTKARGQLLP